MTILTSAAGIAAVMPANSQAVDLRIGLASLAIGASSLQTYTVPAGKMAVLRSGTICIGPTTPASVVATVSVKRTTGVAAEVMLLFNHTTLWTQAAQNFELILHSGDQVNILISNYSGVVTGNVYTNACIDEVDL